MSGLVPFTNNSTLDYTALLDRLDDLAQFGVRLHPIPQNNKCVCGGKAEWPWCHGWGYDNLCESCSKREGDSSAFYDRIYTNQTVFVSDPILAEGSKIDTGDGVFRQVHHSLLYGLVVISRQLCLIRTLLAYIPGMEDVDWPPTMYLGDLCDLTTGEVIVNSVFHINYRKLDELRQTQPPL